MIRDDRLDALAGIVYEAQDFSVSSNNFDKQLSEFFSSGKKDSIPDYSRSIVNIFCTSAFGIQKIDVFQRRIHTILKEKLGKGEDEPTGITDVVVSPDSTYKNQITDDFQKNLISDLEECLTYIFDQTSINVKQLQESKDDGNPEVRGSQATDDQYS